MLLFLLLILLLRRCSNKEVDADAVRVISLPERKVG
jgi:hypothetical protein